MKKFFSFIFSLAIILGIAAAIYFNRDFVKTNFINRIRGVYYVHKGDKAYRQMKMNQAIRMYNRGVKYFPGHYTAWYNLGNIYVAYEDYYSALYAYSEAFKHNPKMMIARMNYGIVASQKIGNFDIALEQFNKITNTERKLISIPYIFDNRISSKENKAIAYYNEGVTYRMKYLYTEDWEKQRKYLIKAIEAYKKSLEISPKRYDTLYNLGLAYHISGRYSEAGEYYCKAIETKPMSYEAHFNLAVLLRKLRHYKESYEEIEKAATLITALDQNTAAVQYVAIVMNDISQSLYGDEEYKDYLKTILEKEKERKEIENQEKKQKDKINGPMEIIKLVKGKVMATEELDEAMLENFGKCPSLHYFIEEDDE